MNRRPVDFQSTALPSELPVLNPFDSRRSSPPVNLSFPLAPNFCRVEVLDAGAGFDPAAVAGKGLGLRLVDKLASRWGVETARGTLVWFEVDRRRRRFSR